MVRTFMAKFHFLFLLGRLSGGWLGFAYGGSVTVMQDENGKVPGVIEVARVKRSVVEPAAQVGVSVLVEAGLSVPQPSVDLDVGFGQGFARFRMGNPYLSIVFNELTEIVGVVGLGLANPCGNHLDMAFRSATIGRGRNGLFTLGEEIVLLRLGTMLVKCSVSSLTKGLREKSNSASIR